MPDHDIDSEFLYPPAKWGNPKSGVEMVEDAMMSIDKVRDLIAASAEASERFSDDELEQYAAKRATADASLIDRLHTAEAKVAILESKWDGIPWDDLYGVLRWMGKNCHDDWALEGTERIERWLDTNRTKETQP